MCERSVPESGQRPDREGEIFTLVTEAVDQLADAEPFPR
jgi:hypothetical protein